MTLRRMTLLAFVVLALGGTLNLLGGDPPRAWWPEGTRRHEGKGNPGHERGTWSYWYRDGQLRERGRYQGGHKVGPWTQWHPNGQKASTGDRVWDEATHASVRQGPWMSWHENGVLRSEGSYEGGERTGVWQTWNLQGDDAVLNGAESGTFVRGEKVE
jgi:antitoxin component YwqK of YwqJK toxin-antitoxin module